MATVINQGDLLLQGISPRLQNITSNYITISASSESFSIDSSGNYIPAIINYKALLIGNLNGDVVWSVTRNDQEPQVYTIDPDTNELSISGQNIVIGTVITVTATLTYLGQTYTASKILSTITGELSSGTISLDASRLSFLKLKNTTTIEPSTILLSASVSNLQDPKYFWSIWDPTLNAGAGAYKLVQMPQGVPVPQGVQGIEGVQGSALINSATYSLPSFSNTNSKEIKVVATGTNNTVGIEDNIDILYLQEGDDAVQVTIDNQNINIPCSSQGLPKPGLIPLNTQMLVVRGINYLYPPDVTYSVQGVQGFSSPVTINTAQGVPILSQPPGYINIPSILQDSAEATFRATVGGVNYDRKLVAKKVLDGVAGNDSKTLSLTATGLAFIFENINSTISNSPPITLIAQLQNITGTPVFTAQAFNSSNQQISGNISLTGSGNNRILSSAQFNELNQTGTKYVKVTVAVTENSITYTDTVTIFRSDNGSDTLNMVLTNEVHNVPATSQGSVSASDLLNASSNILVFKGTLDETSLWTFTKVDSPAGFTTDLTGEGTPEVILSVSSFPDNIDAGQTIITAIPPAGSVGISAITKEFSVTKTKAGAQGQQGVQGTEGAQGPQGASYWIITAPTINLDNAGVYSPNKVTATMQYQSASMQGPVGFGSTRWKVDTGIAYSQGVVYTTRIADSSTSSQSYTWPVTGSIPQGIDLIRIAGYIGAPSSGVKIDEEIINIIRDGLQGSQGSAGLPGAQGPQGVEGNTGTAYWITTSAPVAVKNLNGSFTPSTITVEAKKQTGSAAVVETYTGGRLTFEVSQGAEYSAPQGPTGVQGSLTVTIPANTTKIRFTAYTGSSLISSAIYDSEEVPITPAGSQGIKGDQGLDATVYWMDMPVQSINIDKTGTSTPNAFTATIFSKTGDNPTTVYPGRFWIEKSVDGNTWTQIYKTATTATQGVYTQTTALAPTDTSRTIRVRVYDPIDTSFLNPLDTDHISIVRDGAQGAQGIQGAQGQQGVAYWMTLSNPALNKNLNGTYSPPTVTAQLYQKLGSGAPQGYPGRITAQVKLTTQGVLSPVQGPATNQTSYTITPPLNTEYIVFKGYSSNNYAATSQQITDQFDQENTVVLEDGLNSIAYWMTVDTGGVSRNSAGVYTPAAVTAKLYSQSGSTGPQLYTGRITAEVLLEGQTVYGAVQGGINELNTYTFTVPANAAAIKFKGYLTGGTITLLDEEIVNIINDGVQGPQGQQGANAVAYSMIVSNSSVKKLGTGNYNPLSVSATLYSQIGATSRAVYLGRFIVDKSVNYGPWTTVTTSTVNTSTITVTLPTGTTAENWTAIRIRAFLGGGTTTQIQEEVVTIYADGAQGNIGAQGSQGLVGKDIFGVEIVGTGPFIKPADSAVVNPTTGIALTAAVKNITSPLYTWSKQLNSTGTFANITGATTATYTVPSSDYTTSTTNTYKVTVTGKANGTTVTTSDQQTIVRVDDGDPNITMELSNSSITVPADANGTVLSYIGTGTQIKVYEGSTALIPVTTTPANGQYTITTAITPAAAITVGTRTISGTTATYADYSAWTSTTLNSLYVTFTATGKTKAGISFTLTEVQTLAKAKAGISGAANFGVDITGAGIFVKPSGGTVTPSAGIALTAVPRNVQGVTYVWAKQTGSTGGFTNITGATSAIYTIPIADYATILTNTYRVTVNGIANGGQVSISDQQTVIRVDEGDDAINIVNSNENVSLPADGNGLVTSYTASGTTIQVYEGATPLTFTTNTTLANGQYSISTPTVTPSASITVGARSGSGTTTAVVANHSVWTSTTIDSIIITYKITAKNRNGTSFTLTTTQTLSKAKSGPAGIRGSLTGYAAQYAMYSASWVDATANRVINNMITGQTLTTALTTTTHLRIGDQVTITNAASPNTTSAITRYWGGASWLVPGTVIDGNLLVRGTISGDKIIAGTIQVDRLSSGNASIVQGPLNGGTFGLGDNTPLIGNTYAVGRFTINSSTAWALAAENTSTSTLNGWANGILGATRATGVAIYGFNIVSATAAKTSARSFGYLGVGDISASAAIGGGAASLKSSSWALTSYLDDSNPGIATNTNRGIRYRAAEAQFALSAGTGTVGYAGNFKWYGNQTANPYLLGAWRPKSEAVLGVETESLQSVLYHSSGTNIGKERSRVHIASSSGYAIYIFGSTQNSTGAAYQDVNIRCPGSVVTFTGAHEAESDVDLEIGDIVVDDQVLDRATLSNVTFSVIISSQANQPGVLGVVAESRDRTLNGQSLQTVYTLDEAGNPIPVTLPADPWEKQYKITVNAVGEGQLNVCGEAGNIQRGDLIVTSSIPGKGMKQGDNIIRSYTVAKARESAVFDSPNQIKQIACIYLSG